MAQVCLGDEEGMAVDDLFGGDVPFPELSINPFPLPSSTPSEGSYSNLLNSSQVRLFWICGNRADNAQYRQNNFVPRKSKRKRVISGVEDDAALRRVLRQCE
jgi:hypothetical protein